MGSLEGKVAFITGAARGQGRSHAIRLAEEGADIIAVDLCDQIPTIEYPMSTPDDLDETVRLVEALDRRIIATITDVRDGTALTQALQNGVAELGGRLDIVCANAGILAVTLDEPTGPEARRQVWQDTIDVNLTGVWNTLEAATPLMIDAGNGGTIIITSSAAGLATLANRSIAMDAYATAKHGLVGLVRNAALDLAVHGIRVNSIHPSGVHTPLIENDVFERYMATHTGFAERMANAMPVDAVDARDISNAVVYLAADSGRYVTGIQLPVDAGQLL